MHNADNSLNFNVSIIQDEFLEYEECFVTAISLPNSVSDSLMVEIAGGKDTALVCIENDDSKLYYYMLSGSSFHLIWIYMPPFS